MTDSWRDNLVTTQDGIRAMLADTRRIAVLGIKTEAQAGQAAFYVPEYLHGAGLDVVPVPVYYPDVTEILGRRVYRRLADIDPPVDMVNVFRRSQDVPPHLQDILDAAPRYVWLQSGIRHDETALALAENGIKVVQDRCLMVEHRTAIR